MRLEEVFEDSENLVLIEWADKFYEELGFRNQKLENFIEIKFKHFGREDKREIEIIYG